MRSLLVALLLAQAVESPEDEVSVLEPFAPPPALVWEGAPSPEAWPGLGTPSIDCVAAGDGTMACTGATCAAQGSPTVGSSPWGGASVLNGTTQYHSLGTQKCAAVGDSIMSATLVARFQAVTGCKILNYNNPGDQSAAILAQYTTNVLGQGFKVLLVEGGINDFNVGGVDPSVPLANLSSIVTQAVADGTQVVWMNVTPEMGFGSWSAAIQTKIESLNASIAANGPGLGARVVDAYTLLGDPAEPRQLLAAYDSGDHLHPSADGATALGSAMAAQATGPFFGCVTGCTMAVKFMTDGSAGYRYVFTRGTAATEDFYFRLASGTSLRAHFGGSEIVCGTVAGVHNSAVATYKYLTNGTSIIRCALNGVAAADVTNAAGPVVPDLVPLELGRRSDGFYLSGSFDRFGYWAEPTDTPTSAQLASATRQAYLRDSVRPPGTATTWTRNAAQYGLCADGTTLCLFPANVPVCDSSGCYVWQGFVETLLQTNTSLTEAGSPDTATAPWVLDSDGVTAIPVANIVSATDPTGATSNVTQLAFPAIAGANLYSRFRQPFTGTAASWTSHTCFRAVGGNGTVYIALTDDAASATSVALAAVTTAWKCALQPGVTAGVTKTLSAATWQWALGPDGRAWTGQPTTQSACTILIWNPNATATAVAMPPVTATSGTVSVPANVVTVPNGGIVGDRWAVSSLLSARDWTVTSGTFGAIWQNSSNAYATANAVTLFHSGTNLALYVTGSDAQISIFTAAHGLTGSGEADVRVQYNGIGNVKIVINGVEKTVVRSGAGTLESVTKAAGMKWGDTTFQFNGAIRVVKVCNGQNWQGCRP